MQDTTDKLLEHCIEYATDLLTETGEAYPFGAFADTVGNVHPLEMEIDKKNVPNIGKVMQALEKYCTDEMAEGRVTSYALSYEVSLKFSEDEPAQDCLAIDIRGTEEVPLFYLPFEKKGDQTAVGEVFAVKRS